MSQEDVERLLSKYPEGLTLREIYQKLKLNPSSVKRNLKRLIKRGEVKTEEVNVRVLRNGKYIIKKIKIYKLTNQEKALKYLLKEMVISFIDSVTKLFEEVF